MAIWTECLSGEIPLDDKMKTFKYVVYMKGSWYAPPSNDLN